MQKYGHNLDPYRSLQTSHGAKVDRLVCSTPNKPTTIDQNQSLSVSFPPLGSDDVIKPGTARLAFDIALTSDDTNRTLVQNIGRAIVKKVIVKVSGTHVYSLDEADLIGCYEDMWLTKNERTNLTHQGIDTSTNQNTTRLRIGAANKDSSKVEDSAISTAYGTRFSIPLDFEILTAHMPYHQSGLFEYLEYILEFNTYGRTISLDTDATAVEKTSTKYAISNIALEYEMLTNRQLAEDIRASYMNRVAILYTNIMHIRKEVKDKADTLWHVELSNKAKSMKGVLLLFENETDFARDTEKFYNPKITNVAVQINGKTSQLYANGLKSRDNYDEAVRYFGTGKQRRALIQDGCKELALSDVSVGQYLTKKYALFPHSDFH
jgi:hypothetical protein